MQIHKIHEREGEQTWTYTGDYEQDKVIPIKWNDYDFDLDCHFIASNEQHQKHIGDRLILYPDEIGGMLVSDPLTGYILCTWEKVQFDPILVAWDGNEIVITPELQHDYLGDYFSEYTIKISNGDETWGFKHSMLYSDRIMLSKETLNNILIGNLADNPYIVSNEPIGMFIPQKYYDKETSDFYAQLEEKTFYKMRDQLGDVEYIYMPIVDDEEATQECSTN